MDMLHKALKWADHNRYLVAALVVSLVVSIVFVACAPMTNSVLNPGTEVTAAQLQAEAATLKGDYAAKLKLLKLAQKDIEDQIAFRTQIVAIVGSLGEAAVGGALNPTVGLAAAMQLLTLSIAGGALMDNRRKDKVLAKKSAKK